MLFKNSTAIIYKKTDEWYIEWQQVAQQLTASDSDWYIEWQRVVQQMEANESKEENSVTLGFKLKQKANLVLKEFYSIFSITDNL